MNINDAKKLQKNLENPICNIWDKANQKDVFSFSEKYKHFLSAAKTEREAIEYIKENIKKEKFTDISKISKANAKTKKVYKIYNNKCIAVADISSKKISDGVNIIASHIDSPRLDLKQKPVYEDSDLVFLKTHYYGGIRKYHWLALPLAIHGTIIDKDGKQIKISIGEDKDDPVFVISDLLPHLARKSYETKKISEGFDAEKLNVIVGSIPIKNEEISGRFKLALLDLLHKKYKICEQDFTSSEIEIVPAGVAKDVGFDKSLVGSYGQDDRICAFASLEAIKNRSKNQKASVAIFFDKEEVGSDGNTGAQSNIIEDFLSDLLFLNKEDTSQRTLRKTMQNSHAISADVTGAFDPNYKDVYEERNSAKIGGGVCLTKFTGSGGKYSANDASAEYFGKLRILLNKKNILWQTGELGKIDEGGGGTVAKYISKYGIETIDAGPAILSMHSPFEIASKADLFSVYESYKAFYEELI